MTVNGELGSFTGVLAAIHVAPGASAPMVTLDEVELVPGVGLVGDRYATRTGTYSQRHHIDRQVTLIEVETLDALARDHGVTVAPYEHRRNLTTRGVPVGHLVGRYLKVGECVLYGGRLNVPCRYLEDLLGRPVFRPLIHRSGLNGRVIIGGTIRKGDVIQPIDRSMLPADLVAANEEHGLEPPPEVQ
jgi:MOSC domain-containing protein YiiM